MPVRHRLYLRVGDFVVHPRYEEWGAGKVVEEMTSVLEGGTCLVRVDFEDGHQRTFDNNLDSPSCCYFFGIRRHQHPLFDPDGDPDFSIVGRKMIGRNTPKRRGRRAAKRLSRG